MKKLFFFSALVASMLFFESCSSSATKQKAASTSTVVQQAHSAFETKARKLMTQLVEAQTTRTQGKVDSIVAIVSNEKLVLLDMYVKHNTGDIEQVVGYLMKYNKEDTQNFIDRPEEFLQILESVVNYGLMTDEGKEQVKSLGLKPEQWKSHIALGMCIKYENGEFEY